MQLNDIVKQNLSNMLGRVVMLMWKEMRKIGKGIHRNQYDCVHLGVG